MLLCYLMLFGDVMDIHGHIDLYMDMTEARILPPETHLPVRWSKLGMIINPLTSFDRGLYTHYNTKISQYIMIYYA